MIRSIWSHSLCLFEKKEKEKAQWHIKLKVYGPEWYINIMFNKRLQIFKIIKYVPSSLLAENKKGSYFSKLINC